MKNNNNRNIFQILTKASEVILITGLTAGFTSPAQAKQFNFSYSGLGVDASGVLTTDEIPNSSGYFTVTDINGQRNGATITALLPPESFPPNPPNPPFTFSNNNLISPEEPFVDFSGISYLVEGQPQNFFYYNYFGESEGYAETDNPDDDPNTYRFLDQLSLEPVARVPEPSSGSSLVVALLGGAWLLKKKK